MKKFLLFAAIALLGITATNAQVKFGFGVGYAIPTGDIADFTDGGVSAHLELGYGVTENIDVSFLYTGDFLVGSDLNVDTGLGQATGSIGNVAVGAYMLNGRYYFTESKFKPYGSLGLGLATIGAIEVDGTSAELAASTSNFAFRPALGFKYGVLNMNAAYLSAGKTGDASVNDFTINLGLLFTFGGN
ncbi:outer membrane beta-barrel protein [Aquimarina algiphila]|uniref:outer membrane beta-barrel protein n=1 Tax=Aquimarina algiphila TaxID=2047982 RepID=UPI0023304771|nr:outer membrane beta-barrel protein [Aquimarina algiphila]